MSTIINVLILVVVDNGLVPSSMPRKEPYQPSLNPCCSGQWSSTGETAYDWAPGEES